MSGIDLSKRFFLDTNIFVYSFDADAPRKQQIARELIDIALRTQRGVISTQVIQEFLNVALHKFARPMGILEAREYLQTVLLPLCQHYPSTAYYDRALLLKEETGYGLNDVLVVTAAVETSSKTLLTEDLQDGRIVQGIKIVNPFAV